MIAVIGAEDGVKLVLDVAEEMQVRDALVARSYRAPDEAVDLARELDGLCSVILFTGRLPYVMALARGGWTARLDYIPHEGTDLYRTLAELLLRPEFRGRVPTVSLDSIDPEVAAEAFADLGVPPPEHVLSLGLVEQDFAFDAARLAAMHEERFRSGDVELCLTCVAAVARELTAMGVPTVRMAHSRLVVREALGRSRLALRLAHAEAAQIAVCVVEFRAPAAELDGPRGSEQRVAEEVARRYATLLGGTVVTVDGSEVVIHTSRGSIDRQLHAEVGDRSSPLRTEFRELVSIGIGFGATPVSAEEHARLALPLARRERVPCICTEDDVIVPLDSGSRVGEALESGHGISRLAETLGMGSAAVRKLQLALRDLDPSAFTARQFAAAYGVQSRSARRIIASLESAGLIEACGTRPGAGAGRPQIVYRIDAAALGTA